ncbi:UNVERIFIED_CONTAM: hypothetical protein Sangu_2862300 [Sesamum angustifolium]|uniref:PGG domain-containing protein n=1 Tax=Sesamum angustifolium TaxID=2727405 RepID=A0AAW2IP60_9LAMI
MAGNVYLRTNRFEVKLEAITFKTRDLNLVPLRFSVPQGRVGTVLPLLAWNIMRHPRDHPSAEFILLALGFLKKKDLFPFEEFGLTKHKVDIGYLAAKVLKEPKCKTWELAELARKVLGIKKMIGLTEASSFERHEQIKCAICQLFITSVIAMGLLRTNEKKLDVSHKKSTFLKNLNSLHLLAEGWFKLPKGKKKDEMIQVEEEEDSVHVHIGEMEDMFGDDLVAASPFGDSLLNAKTHGGDFGDDFFSDSELEEVSSGEKFGHFPGVNEGDSSDSFGTEGTSSDDNSAKAVPRTTKMPLKGILKCPSTGFSNYKLSSSESDSPTPKDHQTGFLGRIAAIEAIVSIQSENRDVKTALDVISANISAATFLASVSLTLSALIGAWIANNSNIFQSELIYGDDQATMSIKYITLLICFSSHFRASPVLQCFIHANYLISPRQRTSPRSTWNCSHSRRRLLVVGESTTFAITLLLWFFGPIPMFAIV